MPWKGPEHQGDFPSLGWELGQWIEEHCVIADGDHRGQPFLLTDEMWRFLVFHYRLKLEADPARYGSAWVYRRSQLVRPQKWGKGPFSAAIICAEAVGPALFAGWNADGDPVGRQWSTPLIQITATADDQTANVYRHLVPMIELGPLADLIPDTGETRINLPGGGQIEPVSSNARTRLGQPVTFVLQDETQLWVKSNRGHMLADAQRRGAAGMSGRTIETTNAWDPTEDSVAQQTGESRLPDIYKDHTPPPVGLSMKNKVERRRWLRKVYGDSWWIDRDRIEADILELIEKGEVAQAERFFGNKISSGVSAWLKDDAWARKLAPRAVPDGTKICLGFDGSDSDDWTGIRAETLDGYSFTPTFNGGMPTVWDPSQYDHKIPRSEVHAAMDEIQRRYKVVRAYCDPREWQTDIETWQLKYGEKRVLVWETNRITQMHASLQRFVVDLADFVTHDDCKVTALHINNARRVARTGERYILGKPSQHQKIDMGMCTVLAHEARCDAVAAGATNSTTRRKVVVSSR